MGSGFSYFSKPEPSCDEKGHVTTSTGKGKCKGLEFEGVSAMVLSYGVHTNRVLISWVLKKTSQNLSNVKYFIDRGESPENMAPLFREGISATTGVPEFVDHSANLLDFYKEYVYQIRAVEYNSDGDPIQTFTSWQFHIDGLEDQVSLYIINEHCFLYRYTSVGIPVMIFKKRHDGVKCPVCWDKILKRVTRSDCTSCAGTGVLRGYYDPIEGWMHIGPDPKASSVQIQGVSQPSQTVFEYTNYPIIRPGDVVVEMKNNNFWRFVNIQFPQRNRVIVLQRGLLDVINRSDVEYQGIDIPQDRRRELVAQLDERVAGDSL